VCHIQNQPFKYLIEVVVPLSFIVYSHRVYSHHLMYSVVSSVVRVTHINIWGYFENTYSRSMIGMMRRNVHLVWGFAMTSFTCFLSPLILAANVLNFITCISSPHTNRSKPLDSNHCHPQGCFGQWKLSSCTHLPLYQGWCVQCNFHRGGIYCSWLNRCWMYVNILCRSLNCLMQCWRSLSCISSCLHFESPLSEFWVLWV
jgi:hypothetical protein